MSSFVQEYEQHRPCIVVELPELRKTSGGLFSAREVMTYAVCVQGGNSFESPRPFPKHGVRHRYSDFEALSRGLQRRFGTEGMLIPPLPPKGLRKKHDVDFIKQRMNGLQFFMEGIAASPFLFHDILTQKFLKRTTTEGAGSIVAILDEGDNSVGQIIPLPSSSSSSKPPSSPLSSASMAAMHNQGYIQWTEFLSSFVLPPDPDVMVEKVRIELDSCEKVLSEVMEGGKALAAGFGQYARGLQAFSYSMHVLAEGERRVEVLNKVEVTEGREDSSSAEQESSNDNASSPLRALYTIPLPELASHTADLYANIVPTFLAAPGQASFFFSPLIEYEQSRIQSLKTLLAGRNDLRTSILKLQKKVEGLRQPSASSADRELYESRLAQAEVHLYKFTKALLCYTLPAVAQQRTWNLNRALANLAAISTPAASASFGQTMGYLKVLGWDAAEVVEEANENGVALMVPHIPVIALPQAGEEKNMQREERQKETTVLKQKSPAATASAAVVAARKPGSFLYDKPLPSPVAVESAGGEEERKRGSGLSTSDSGGDGNSITTTWPMTDPIVTVASSLGSGDRKGASGKAPWESDDEVENPFEKEEGV
ncbi:sorting nexin [Nannochloropsis oceanica]